MSFFTSYDLRGWGPSGRFLSAFEKEEIQDYVFDEGVEDCGCSHSNADEHIMSFCDSSHHAYSNVRNAISDYASRHSEFLFELEYASEAGDHQKIRFRGNEIEGLDRIEMFPPFVKLTRIDDDNSPYILEFIFTSARRADEIHIFALLNRPLSANALEALEDSVVSYDESVGNYTPVEMVDDILNSEHIDHLIIKPSYSFTI